MQPLREQPISQDSQIANSVCNSRRSMVSRVRLLCIEWRASYDSDGNECVVRRFGALYWRGFTSTAAALHTLGSTDLRV